VSVSVWFPTGRIPAKGEQKTSLLDLSHSQTNAKQGMEIESMEMVDAHASTPAKGLDKGLLKTKAGGHGGDGVIAQTNLETSVKAQDKTGSPSSVSAALSEHEPATSNVDEKAGYIIFKELLENTGTLKIFVMEI
jgi:hypothetical protein